MLNELCQLASALEEAGISPKEWHSQLHELPRASIQKPCYRIWINPDNSIEAIEGMDPKLAAILRKWEPSNGSSFPAFNTQPLYRITDEQQKAKIRNWKDGKSQISVDELRSWCTPSTSNWDRKIQKKMDKCLKEIPLELNEILHKGNHTNRSSVQVLIGRVSLYEDFEVDEATNIGLKSFRQAIENFAWQTMSDGTEAGKILPLLVHEGDASKKTDEDRGLVSVFLDITDWNNYGYPVAHEKSLDWLNDNLVKASLTASNPTLMDAFGFPFAEATIEDKLPSVKLPIIADVKLRSMFSAHRCQYRYGKIEASSFPIGRASRTRAKGALEWLKEPSREGYTWGRADLKELVFAYPSVLPKKTIPMVAFLGAGTVEGQAEARFVDMAADVIGALKGLSPDLHSLGIRVFALKKMDKARTKVVFYHNYSAQRLFEAANAWQAGCANVPEFLIKTWAAQKGECKLMKPAIPYPLQIAPCLNRVWKLDGSSECETDTIIHSQGIELLLDEHADRFVPHLLTVFLQNSNGLLLSMGNEQHKGFAAPTIGKNQQILLTPSILGLLLYKVSIYKEKYMANAPFLVGRVLKLSDELHSLYCQEVRENNLPSQLVGNSLMVAALNSPMQALAQLGQRLNPYISWAKQFRTKKAEVSWKAGWLLKLFEDTMNTLTDIDLPVRCTDAEKAQIFIGYLSSLPKKQGTELSAQENENNSVLAKEL